MTPTLRQLAIVVAFGLGSGLALAQQAPQREITQIGGDLYRFQNNFHLGYPFKRTKLLACIIQGPWASPEHGFG